jgi:hypothetical protein
MKMLTGTCLCGNVMIEVPDRFDFMGYCHCLECRKASGSDYSIVGSVTADNFYIVKGVEFIKYYHKSSETDAAFCRHCGSSLFNRKLKTHRYNIRLGILDELPSQRPTFHIFVGSKAPWDSICDDLPQHAAHPPKTEG